MTIISLLIFFIGKTVELQNIERHIKLCNYKS